MKSTNDSPRILLVYYSRSGTTKKVAETISSILHPDLEEVIDETGRAGIVGWIKAGRDAGNKSLTLIKGVQKDPALYQLTVIGTPIWNGTFSTPIRTYLSQQKDSFNRVAFFSTGDDKKSDVFEEMVNVSGKKSVASLHLWRKGEVENGKYVKRAQRFAEDILEAIHDGGIL